MQKTGLVNIDRKYLKYLQNIDSRVPVKNKRPYAYCLFEVNEHSYAIPITSLTVPASGKPRNPSMTVLITRGNRNLGALLLNNMIPVPKDVVKEIDVDNTILLEKEQLSQTAVFIRNNSEEISKKARDVYGVRAAERDNFYLKVCCNFNKLESACLEYCKINGIEHPALTDKKKHEHFEHIDILQENGIITKTQSSYVKENYELLGYEYTKEDVEQCISYVKSGGDKEVALNILEDCGIAHDTFESGLLSTRENTLLNELGAESEPKTEYEPEQ